VPALEPLELEALELAELLEEPEEAPVPDGVADPAPELD
jgi:hypothetical protein